MKKVNGNENVLTEQQQEQRQQIIDLELKARYWEAQWKIRFYTLESEKLQPEYETYLIAERAKQEKMVADLQKALQDQADLKKATQEDDKHVVV